MNRDDLGFQPRPGQRQLVKFTFFKVAPEWRRLDGDERQRQIAELAAVVESWAGRNLVRCYSTMGTRGDTDFMIWQVSYELEDIQRMAGELMGTALGGYLDHAVFLSLDDEELGLRRKVRRTRARTAPRGWRSPRAHTNTCSSTR